MMNKNGMAWTIVLTLMMASLAGCLGGDAEEETRNKRRLTSQEAVLYSLSQAPGAKPTAMRTRITQSLWLAADLVQVHPRCAAQTLIQYTSVT